MDKVLKRVGLSKSKRCANPPETESKTTHPVQENAEIRENVRRRRRSKSRRRHNQPQSRDSKKTRGLFNIDWESVRDCKSCKSRAITRKLCSKRTDNELYRSNSFKFERFVRGSEEVSTLGKKVGKWIPRSFCGLFRNSLYMLRSVYTSLWIIFNKPIFRPTVIITDSHVFAIPTLSLLGGIRTIHLQHFSEFMNVDYLEPEMSVSRSGFYKWSLSCAEKVIVQNKISAQILKRSFRKLSSPVVVLYPSVDVGPIKTDILIHLKHIVPDIPVGHYMFLVFGEYRRRSNFSLALKAFDMLVNSFNFNADKLKLHLVICGNYNNNNQRHCRYFNEINMELMSCKYNAQVTLLKVFPMIYRKSLISQSTAVLHTIPHDIFSMPILECLYFGRPIIAPDSGFATEVIVHNVNGFLSEPEPDMYFKFMRKMVTEKTQVGYTGYLAMIDYSNRFSFGIFIKQLHQLVLKEKPNIVVQNYRDFTMELIKTLETLKEGQVYETEGNLSMDELLQILCDLNEKKRNDKLKRPAKAATKSVCNLPQSDEFVERKSEEITIPTLKKQEEIEKNSITKRSLLLEDNAEKKLQTPSNGNAKIPTAESSQKSLTSVSSTTVQTPLTSSLCATQSSLSPTTQTSTLPSPLPVPETPLLTSAAPQLANSSTLFPPQLMPLFANIIPPMRHGASTSQIPNISPFTGSKLLTPPGHNYYFSEEKSAGLQPKVNQQSSLPGNNLSNSINDLKLKSSQLNALKDMKSPMCSENSFSQNNNSDSKFITGTSECTIQELEEERIAEINRQKMLERSNLVREIVYIDNKPFMLPVRVKQESDIRAGISQNDTIKSMDPHTLPYLFNYDAEEMEDQRVEGQPQLHERQEDHDTFLRADRNVLNRRCSPDPELLPDTADEMDCFVNRYVMPPVPSLMARVCKKLKTKRQQDDKAKKEALRAREPESVRVEQRFQPVKNNIDNKAKKNSASTSESVSFEKRFQPVKIEDKGKKIIPSPSKTAFTSVEKRSQPVKIEDKGRNMIPSTNKTPCASVEKRSQPVKIEDKCRNIIPSTSKTPCASVEKRSQPDKIDKSSIMESSRAIRAASERTVKEDPYITVLRYILNEAQKKECDAPLK